MRKFLQGALRQTQDDRLQAQDDRLQPQDDSLWLGMTACGYMMMMTI